ncbi:twin-arginine translocase subunit TatC [Virgibacillus halodenitrificans]|uniref:Sec-independent protein translocase protein TatC n=1 Tax=Virgibacillus halodenitrificans TaxID=1482 RepID=A0AAC9NL08_VIRHA|nr:twin-arginine translocase subunit TatC [Virgibacillus halodenitrificans]APC48490.1 twin arginine-targeting protein translocase TatC [Virgibacillus halodenitrificans]MBD1222553.1 twin-arginine translocase subunit TatC [Virgibacillus halodenitrificans]MCG1028363.1 twin-arginine translocase subunit TatC [Virgibacillus halodenitrificans]WHX27300.1 twin-arginine translocase subunit TatC [Virgibacillus halodenitrificans]CDQ35699.1 Sec-independent protein translocase protein TatCd [Virgibacillus h
MSDNGAQIDKEMNLTGHLSELRNRLIVTALFFLAFFIVGFIFVKDIYSFFVNDLDFKLTVISPGEIIWIHFTMAGLVAIAATLPLLALQIWLFIKPGLTPTERKASLAYIPAVFILFIVGLVFGYIMFIKLILPFLLSLNSGMFNEMFTVDKYFRFLLRITLPFALLFEIPIVAMFLTALGVLTPDFMRKTRKYAYLVLVIIGTIVTPPDFILQLVVAVPLIILYEISIYLAAIVYRRKLKKHEAFMREES